MEASLLNDVLYKHCMVQALTGAHDAGSRMTREPHADPEAVAAVLTGSWSMLAVVVKSLDTAAEETTVRQYRALAVLASHGPQRLVDLAGALGVTPSSAGRMCDRLARKGLIRRHRARADRRAVLISVTPAGRHVADEAAELHRSLIADILGRLPASRQRTIAAAFREFTDAAAAKVPHGPAPAPEGPAAVPAPRAPSAGARPRAPRRPRPA